MKERLLALCLLVACAGCISPSAVSQSAHGIGSKVTPAARAFTDGTRRIVRYVGQAAEDTTLAAKVQAALKMHKGLEEGKIQVRVEESVVYLRGRVQSVGQKQRAAQVAGATVGVAGIVNHLRVAPLPNASGG